MNKLNAMSTFVQIVDSGSLTSAAEVLDTSLPTVVRTLASLEEHLKTRLLTRTTRKIALTEEGCGYLERCRSILYEIDDAELALSAQQTKPSGKLLISAPVMFGSMKVASIVNEFLRNNNKVNAELLLLDRNVNLVEEGIDVAIRIGRLSDSSMIAKNVGYVRKVICGTPALINSLNPINHPKDLLKVPCIRFTGLSYGANWQLFENGKIHTLAIKGPLVCNHGTSSLDAVCEGMGLGLFLSYQVESKVASGELQIILAEFEPPSTPVSVVYSHTKLMSTRVRFFVDWVVDELRKELNKDQ